MGKFGLYHAEHSQKDLFYMWDIKTHSKGITSGQRQ